MQMEQFAPQHVVRELNKAYCGFVDQFESDLTVVKPVATGHWGGGTYTHTRCQAGPMFQWTRRYDY